MNNEKQIDKLQVRRHFSYYAREYDRYAVVQKTVANRLAEFLDGHIQPCRRVLEIGCGTGLLSHQLLALQPDLQLVLSDLAHGMSQHVQQVLPQVPVCDADAAALPFVADCFELVTSSSVYQWLNDLPNAFRQVSQVLAENGLFALALFGEKTLYELRHSHQAALPEHVRSHVQRFPTLDDVTRAMEGRFEVLTLRSEFEVEWHADVAGLLRSLKKIGAQNASQHQPKGLASRRVMQGMIAHYNQVYKRERGIPATYEVIYLLARRC